MSGASTVFRHDPQLVCYPYSKELRAHAKLPSALQGNAGGRLTSKYVLALYCEKIWCSRDERWKTYLRIQVGHRRPVPTFNEEKLQLAFSKIDCQYP